jgi:hypothetical protein
MGIIKEYRIVMPVTVQEYRVAQIYMTARTQAMEAEQVILSCLFDMIFVCTLACILLLNVAAVDPSGCCCCVFSGG